MEDFFKNYFLRVRKFKKRILIISLIIISIILLFTLFAIGYELSQNEIFSFQGLVDYFKQSDERIVLFLMFLSIPLIMFIASLSFLLRVQNYKQYALTRIAIDESEDVAWVYRTSATINKPNARYTKFDGFEICHRNGKRYPIKLSHIDTYENILIDFKFYFCNATVEWSPKLEKLYRENPDYLLPKNPEKKTKRKMSKAMEKLDMLMEQLKGSKKRKIEGIVGPWGVTGLGSRYRMNMTFRLINWKYSGDPSLKNNEITLRRIVSDKELKEYRKRLNPDEAYIFTARVKEKNDFQEPQAYLEKIIGKSKDCEILNHIEQMKKPVTFDDDLFGTFTLDRRINSFDADTAWNGKKICLSLSLKEKEDDPHRYLETAKQLWADQKNWAAKINDFAAEELLELKNFSWLDDNEEEVTKTEFLLKMKLETITINSDGSFTFWHDDGNLFFGHSIEITGNLKDGLKSADIPG